MLSIIENFAERNNLIIGFCDAIQIQLDSTIDITNVPFVNAAAQERLDPGLFLHGAKSVIVVGMANGKNETFKQDSVLRGRLSAGAVGEDYHKKLHNILEKLAKQMLQETMFCYKIQVDTGPLCEREFAKKSGIGFQGKNCSIISKKFGSMFNIGLFVTSLELGNHTVPNNTKQSCDDCSLCLCMCPTGALNGGYKCDYSKCISMLTQKKGVLKATEMAAIGQSIYGCDICQDICPHNKHIYKEAVENIDEAFPCLEKLLSMNKKEFSTQYSKSSFFWRGRTTILRNAIIALSNSKNPEAELIIRKFLASESEALRRTAEIAIHICCESK